MKDQAYQGYTFTCKRRKLPLRAVRPLLRATYWAADRTDETFRRSMRHSLCFGVLDARGKPVGFCRVMTDYATDYYLADVVLAEPLRGQGLGLAFLRYVLSDERFCRLAGMLKTRDAFGFYEHLGFERAGGRFMFKKRAEANQDA